MPCSFLSFFPSLVRVCVGGGVGVVACESWGGRWTGLASYDHGGYVTRLRLFFSCFISGGTL